MRRLLVLLIAVAWACKDPAQDDKLANITSVPPDTVIELSRGQCFGACPVYTLRADAKGDVRFQGIQFLATSGARHRTISGEALIGLLRQFGQLGYLNIGDAQLRETCREPATDHATVITSLTIDGRKNRVANDHGCPDGPLRDGLNALEKEIDRVLADPGWLRPDAKGSRP